MRFRFTVAAEQDIEEIGDNIGRDNPARAVTFIEALTEKCRRLIEQPATAPLRPEFGDGVRMPPFGRYLVFYSFDANELKIIRVIHGRSAGLSACERQRRERPMRTCRATIMIAA